MDFCIKTATTFTCLDNKWKNTGSSPLPLISCGLVLYSWLFIEIQLNEIAFKELTLVKNVDVT